MFLLGAGSSVPSGLLEINSMTQQFIQQINDEEKIKKVKILMQIAQSYFDKGDIESFLSLLYRLNEDKDWILFRASFVELEMINRDEIKNLINQTQGFIRKQLENISSIDYLIPILYLPFATHIFTLNYDSVIENTLEKVNMIYTDGFTPYWNPASFDEENIKFKIYKLHGSLYWFRTSKGKLIKIPIRGLDTRKMTYITGDSISEVLIYPTIQKEKFSSIYSYLDLAFTKKLDDSDLCVIIGYSFRDKDITEKILESLKRNSDLWLLVVNPHPQNLSDILSVHLDIEEQLRIFYLDLTIEQLLNNSQLNQYLSDIRDNIYNEKALWNRIASESPSQLDENWIKDIAKIVTIGYKKYGLQSRSVYIVNRLYREKRISEAVKFEIEYEINLTPIIK